MTIHKCNCRYVPDHVLENMAKVGIENARLTLQDSDQKRAKREEVVVPMEVFEGAVPPGEGVRLIYDCENKWQQRVTLIRGEGDPATGKTNEDTSYESVGQVRDYLSDVLERISIDNAGMDIICNVNYGSNYMNAFWDGDELTFGNGDGKIFIDFANSLDVVVHELFHGVTQFTAGLVYQSQSGALNEHFSDVFGAVVTQLVKGEDAGQADWLVGNEIMGPDLFGESLRSMKAPGTAYDNALMGTDPQPDHMDNYYAGPADNQGVHINSGIPNKAFYLVAMDIGTPNAAKIWYHTLQKLWPKANFNEAVKVFADSARILTKNGQVPLGSPQVVRSAFKEVGLPV